MASEKTLFLIRGQSFDANTRKTAERISAAGAERVVAVMDERKGVTDTTPFDKISLNNSLLTQLGILSPPENWGWFCGDFCLYAARQKFPDYDHYCLIESDVTFAGNVASEFVRRMQLDMTDILAAQLEPSAKRNRYSLGLSTLNLDHQWGCIFPVTRLSGAAVDAMLSIRLKSLAEGVADKLNDEGVLVGAAQNPALKSRSLESLLPEMFATQSFDTNPPHLLEALQRGEGGDRVYHPVLSLKAILQRIAEGEKSFTPHRLRVVLKEASTNERAMIEQALAQVSKSSLDGAGESVEWAKQHSTKLAYGPEQRQSFLFEALSLASRIKVLDIGANPLIEGDPPYVRLLRAGLAEVYGFEPQETALAALQARKSDHETYLPHAVGDGSDGILYVYAEQGFSSLFEIDAASAALCGFGSGVQEVSRFPVKTRRLDEIAEVPHIDFLKIDVQGAETAVVAFGATKLSEALAVQTEVRLFPIYRNEPRFGDLERELTEQGFEFLRFRSLKHVGLSRRHRKTLRRSEHAQVIDGDAIFVRDLRNIGSFSNEQLRKLALIADAIIDNADLAVRAMEVLEDRGALKRTVIQTYLRMLPEAKLRANA